MAFTEWRVRLGDIARLTRESECVAAIGTSTCLPLSFHLDDVNAHRIIGTVGPF